MGQIVTVIEKPSARPGVVRFETNRVLSGLGHDTFTSPDQITGDRPVDVIARRLFEHGVESVHINSNVITVSLGVGATSAGLKELIEGMYLYYEPGAEPPTLAAPAEG